MRVDIARHFMGRKEWDKARPYADAAAQTYAGWAMLCAAECYEGLEDWDKAEHGALILAIAVVIPGGAFSEASAKCRETPQRSQKL